MLRSVLATLVVATILACAGSGSGTGGEESWEGPPGRDFASDRAACVGQEAAASRVGTQRQAFIRCMQGRGWRRKP